MAVITEADVQYLTKTTHQDYGRGKATDLMLDLQEYPTFVEFMKKHRGGYQSGDTIDGNALTEPNGSVREVGLYFQTDYQDMDGVTNFSIPWAHVHGYITFEERIIKMNRDPQKILDIAKMKKAQLWAGFAKRFEEYFWEAPQNVAGIPKRPFGIPYSIVKNATLGFNGGNPAGFSNGTAGLSSVTYPRWRNFSGAYGAFTDADLVYKMRKAILSCGFMSPVEFPSYEDVKDRWMYAVNQDTKLSLEDLARQQNDNNGFDLASKDGRTTINGNKLRYIPSLDSHTDNPIYGINWAQFNFIFLKDEDFVEGKVERLQNQPTTFKQDIRVTCNTRPVNRRRTFVLHQAA